VYRFKNIKSGQCPTKGCRTIDIQIDKNRMAQLCPQAPGSLFIAFYDLQGYGRNIPTHLHTGLQNVHEEP
jgi:hypothetical protein